MHNNAEVILDNLS